MERTGIQGAASKEGSGQKMSASDEGKQRQTSGMGERVTNDRDQAIRSSQIDESEKDLNALEEEEISGPSEENISDTNYSDTDEDENEGLGDGKLGRKVRGGLGK